MVFVTSATQDAVNFYVDASCRYNAARTYAISGYY
jgi:hypothetical protein